MSDEDLRRVDVPVRVVPVADALHPAAVSDNYVRVLPNAAVADSPENALAELLAWRD